MYKMYEEVSRVGNEATCLLPVQGQQWGKRMWSIIVFPQEGAGKAYRS